LATSEVEKVTHPIDTATSRNKYLLEREIRAQLLREQGTARRQELLKALWKLLQRSVEIDSSASDKNAMAVSTSQSQRNATTLDEAERLSVSC
jgi:hypothetical protein